MLSRIVCSLEQLDPIDDRLVLQVDEAGDDTFDRLGIDEIDEAVGRALGDAAVVLELGCCGGGKGARRHT